MGSLRWCKRVDYSVSVWVLAESVLVFVNNCCSWWLFLKLCFFKVYSILNHFITMCLYLYMYIYMYLCTYMFTYNLYILYIDVYIFIYLYVCIGAYMLLQLVIPWILGSGSSQWKLPGELPGGADWAPAIPQDQITEWKCCVTTRCTKVKRLEESLYSVQAWVYSPWGNQGQKTLHTAVQRFKYRTRHPISGGFGGGEGRE